jgi:hypothetical protein
MQDERFPKWRSWVAAAFLLIVAAIIAIGWPRAQKEAPAPIIVAPEPTPVAPPPPLQLLNRSALIEAAAKAASAYAAGMTIDNAVGELAGRRFELELPLGCAGSTAADTPIENGWRYDADSGILQVAFRSTVQGIAENFFGELSADEPMVEFGKGFWIEREWLREPICPTEPKSSNVEIVGDAPSLAIAEIREAEAPRAKARDGADYRVSKRVALEAAPDQQGLRILISGRLVSDRPTPIQCHSVDRDRQPVCVILARFDRVAVTSANGSETYGAWLN